MSRPKGFKADGANNLRAVVLDRDGDPAIVDVGGENLFDDPYVYLTVEEKGSGSAGLSLSPKAARTLARRLKAAARHIEEGHSGEYRGQPVKE